MCLDRVTAKIRRKAFLRFYNRLRLRVVMHLTWLLKRVSVS